MQKLALAIVAALTMSGCANPLNQVTYGRYTDAGNQAFAAQDFSLAEANFVRAAYNVDWGNLGDAAKAGSLYNLGETQRILRKYSEAEAMLLQALPFAARGWKEDLYKLQMLDTALVLLYFDTHDAAKGWPYLRKTFGKPNSHKYGANVRWLDVYGQYEKELSQLGMAAEAASVREEIDKRKKEPNSERSASP